MWTIGYTFFTFFIKKICNWYLLTNYRLFSRCRKRLADLVILRLRPQRKYWGLLTKSLSNQDDLQNQGIKKNFEHQTASAFIPLKRRMLKRYLIPPSWNDKSISPVLLLRLQKHFFSLTLVYAFNSAKVTNFLIFLQKNSSVSSCYKTENGRVPA